MIAKNLCTNLVSVIAFLRKNAFTMKHLDWVKERIFSSLISVAVLMFSSKIVGMWLSELALVLSLLLTDSVSC
jgi:multisubunit Na+/H+ antiporter MnhG subunit